MRKLLQAAAFREWAQARWVCIADCSWLEHAIGVGDLLELTAQRIQEREGKLVCRLRSWTYGTTNYLDFDAQLVREGKSKGVPSGIECFSEGKEAMVAIAEVELSHAATAELPTASQLLREINLKAPEELVPVYLPRYGSISLERYAMTEGSVLRGTAEERDELAKLRNALVHVEKSGIPFGMYFNTLNLSEGRVGYALRGAPSNGVAFRSGALASFVVNSIRDMEMVEDVRWRSGVLVNLGLLGYAEYLRLSRADGVNLRNRSGGTSPVADAYPRS